MLSLKRTLGVFVHGAGASSRKVTRPNNTDSRRGPYPSPVAGNLFRLNEHPIRASYSALPVKRPLGPSQLKQRTGDRLDAKFAYAKMETTLYDRYDLKWEGDQLRLLSGRLLATIERDVTLSSLWRVRLPDGQTSGLANQGRIRDAAVSLALSSLNNRCCLAKPQFLGAHVHGTARQVDECRATK